MLNLDLTYWTDLGGRTLTAPEIDANFRSLGDAIQELATSGVPQKMIDRIEQDPVASTVTIHFSDGTYYGPYPLPARPINPRGAWVAGADYVAQDLVTFEGSAYLALKSHTASTTHVDFDVMSGNMLLLVARGAPAYCYMGLYSPTMQ